MLPVLTVLTLLTKKHKFWDKEWAWDDSVDGGCDMLLMLTVLTPQTKRDKFWDKVEARDDNVDGCCYMLLLCWLVLTMLTQLQKCFMLLFELWWHMLLVLIVLMLQTKRDKEWARDDNVDGCCCMLLLWWLVLTDVDESLFSRILVYFVVKISTHLDLGYATGAKGRWSKVWYFCPHLEVYRKCPWR